LPKAAKIARKRTGMAGRRAAELERYRLALESMNLNTYDWDIAKNVIYISPAMRETVGFGPDQPFSLKNWDDFIHPDDQPLYRAALVSLLKGESARFECEYRYRARDRSWRWIRQHGLVARGRNGRALPWSELPVTSLTSSNANVLSNRRKPRSWLPSAASSKPVKPCSSCSTILGMAWSWPTTISI